MKKVTATLLILGSIILTSLATYGNVSAVNVLYNVCSNINKTHTSSVCVDSSTASTKNNPIISEIKIAINILSFIIGIIAVLVIIVSGLRMVLGGSDPQTVNSSRDAIIYALIGIIVVVVSQALVVFVLNKIK